MILKYLSVFLVVVGSAFAQVSFMKYEEALKESENTDKLIALTVVSSNCHWCHKFLRETLNDAGVESAIKKDFLYVVINKDTTKLPEGISARLVPTTYFLNKKGQKVMPPVIGYWDAKDFRHYLKDALKKSGRL